MPALAFRTAVVVSLLSTLVLVAPGIALARRALEATVDDLLSLGIGPVAIGHRGFGENLGEDPTRPIENTVPSVRAAYRAGVTVVEVDVQRTRDGEVPAFHDDFLPDLTCLDQLTRDELAARRPEIPSLQAVLQQARQANQATGPLQGLLIVELKAPSPLCDPADEGEPALVASVVRVIRQMRLSDQVILTSFSPALLFLAQRQAPEITRSLTVSGLQFLTSAEIEAVLGLPVTPMTTKALNPSGLEWAEIGAVFRLPGYRSIEEMLWTAAVVGARVLEADLFLLGNGGSPLVATLQQMGLRVFGFTANGAAEWQFLESLGVDGIYTNDVLLGVGSQPPIP